MWPKVAFTAVEPRYAMHNVPDWMTASIYSNFAKSLSVLAWLWVSVVAPSIGRRQVQTDHQNHWPARRRPQSGSWSGRPSECAARATSRSTVAAGWPDQMQKFLHFEFHGRNDNVPDRYFIRFSSLSKESTTNRMLTETNHGHHSTSYNAS